VLGPERPGPGAPAASKVGVPGAVVDGAPSPECSLLAFVTVFVVDTGRYARAVFTMVDAGCGGQFREEAGRRRRYDAESS